MFGDRPNVVGNPNKGAPHKVSQLVSASEFQRLDPVANAGQFGNLGRNSVDGPAYGSLDASLDKSFVIGERGKVQFRAEGGPGCRTEQLHARSDEDREAGEE